MFIVCGVLYAIDSVTVRETKIRLALDLVEGKLLHVTLAFTNPFSKTTTVGYNHRDMVNHSVTIVNEQQLIIVFYIGTVHLG